MGKDITISVCLASYNGEKYISRQLKSILPQLKPLDEIVISDDGSTDRTIDVINSFHDPRIKLFINNGHNYTKNFENALKNSNGDIIFLCDQDDEWMPDKVVSVLRKFSEEDVDLVVTDAEVIDSKGNIISKSYFRSSNVKKGFFRNWTRTRYIGSCIAFKRKMLERILPIPGNSKYIAHDYWIACIGELYYKVGLLNKPEMYYIRHEGNASPGVSNHSNISLEQRIYKRFYTLYFLLKRKNI